MVNFIGSSARIALAGLAQLVEQLFRKQQVRGSSPRVGSEQAECDPSPRRSGEMADALRSGRSGATRGSSSLPFGTRVSFETLTTDRSDREGRSLDPKGSRGKSELHRARVPGESQGGAFRRRQSRLACFRTREQQKPFRFGFRTERLKRAILPAAISDPAASRLLAKAERREQSPHSGDRSQDRER